MLSYILSCLHIYGEGFPTGCSDDLLPWDRTADSPLDTKYMYVVHAEMNAILNKNSSSVSGARMYVVRNLEENTLTHTLIHMLCLI
jgi:deoxycytidylate deaminase